MTSRHALVLCGLLIVPLLIAAQKEASEMQKQVRALADMSAEVRLQELSTLSAERSALQGQLLTWLGNAKTDDEMFAAAYLLGRYRMDQSVRDLNQRLTRKATLPQRRMREALWDEYPFVEALTRIGNPSMPAMVENLAADVDDLTRTLSVRVILGVDGLELGKARVQQARKRASDDDAKRRLEEALIIFDRESDRRSAPPEPSA